jgi:hypothetical protein
MFWAIVGRANAGERRGKRIGRESTRLLEEWLAINNQDPYPSYEEKVLLCTKTGLTYKQVTNWFIHRRSKLSDSNKPKNYRYGLTARLLSLK